MAKTFDEINFGGTALAEGSLVAFFNDANCIITRTSQVTNKIYANSFVVAVSDDFGKTWRVSTFALDSVKASANKTIVINNVETMYPQFQYPISKELALVRSGAEFATFIAKHPVLTVKSLFRVRRNYRKAKDGATEYDWTLIGFEQSDVKFDASKMIEEALNVATEQQKQADAR